jgi:hypothetical protein
VVVDLGAVTRAHWDGGGRVMYFANPTKDAAVHEAMAAGVLGFIDTAGQGFRHMRAGTTWCADNGCFNDAKFDEARWWRFLQDNATDAGSCAFATAPDVLGDAQKTLNRSAPWLPRIRELGYPVAFVAQDGADQYPPPWGEFDVLFIGGSTAFKLGPEARSLIAEAKRRGCRVHMGRVNSLKRYRYAEAVGCDSADGTYLIFGPTVNLPRLLNWVRDLHERPALFGIGDAS